MTINAVPIKMKSGASGILAPLDRIPDSFVGQFTDNASAPIGQVITSNQITVTGIDPQADVSISVDIGEYQINTDAWTSVAGIVNVDDLVRVRHTASALELTPTNQTLTIDGEQDTFTSTTVAGSSLTITASRTTGVAPLGIHFAIFDGTTTKAIYHDISYSWDFGDTGAGNWHNGRSKNVDYGPMAGHIFETDGSYTVTVTSRNAGGIVGSGTVDITVTNPDSVFSGTNTVAISTGTDFTGAPAGADTLTTTTWSTIISQLGSGKRVLLKRGDTWNATAGASLGTMTTCRMGAFGTGTGQTALGTYANDPVISVTGNAGGVTLNISTVAVINDFGIEHIRFVAPNGDASWRYHISGNGPEADHFLINRCYFTGGGANIQHTINSGTSTTGTEYAKCMITNCEFAGNTGFWDLYTAFYKGLLIGNTFVASGSHVVRLTAASLTVLAHNYISGAAANNLVLKFHGHDPATGLITNQYNLITNNVFGGGGDWIVTVEPQSRTSSYNEPHEFILVERNRFLVDYGVSAEPTLLCLHVSASNSVIRNNICDASNNSAGVTMVGVGGVSNEGDPSNIEIYNNTLYKNDAGSVTGVAINSRTSNVTCRNNFGSFSTGSMVSDSGPSSTVSNNTNSSTPAFVDPDNVTSLSRDWNLTVSSTDAIDQGFSVSVFGDFDDPGAARVGETNDLGAHEL